MPMRIVSTLGVMQGRVAPLGSPYVGTDHGRDYEKENLHFLWKFSRTRRAKP